MKNNKSTVSGKFVIFVGFLSFSFAAVFFLLSQYLAITINSLIFSFLLLFFIVLFGIIADIIGTSVAAADEAPFHAKAAKKVTGAKESVLLIRNADRVANITNDVIGDIAGTLSGALGIALGLQIISFMQDLNQFFLNMLITALIAALTVGGKAYGKKIALSNANGVIFIVGKVLAAFSGITGKNIVKK
ncbi:hypothetical protein SPSYN_00244 [Sporotomaculum syntrophicum]|uniref:Uncharacterized protein n=1 Tax=Sporotomaculum syntrophicum TaxID=182264 RepID=A0A9D2WSX3_9FIRM|nr:hypothetical protein [Sporotomaculum syntrophicum]KAF1086525.1 hypothetical protein SPSYN_00244 [Sporotomaculum syntrophicum]